MSSATVENKAGQAGWTTGPPSIPAARRAIAETVLRDAITRYHDAVRRRRETEDRAGINDAGGADDAAEKWIRLAEEEENDARRHLLRAVLSAGKPPTWNNYRAEKKRWPACGVTYQGRVYLAVPSPETGEDLEEGEANQDNLNVMYLVIVEGSAVVGIDVQAVESPSAEPVTSPG